MTILGIVMTFLAVPNTWVENSAIDASIQLASLIVAAGWLILILAGVLSLVSLCAKSLMRWKNSSASR
jgi:uncharacterized membrane protein